MSREIAVIGGGPAGLAAAEVLGKEGLQVTVYDRMPSLGRKFLMAGRSGLNLTHSEPYEQFTSRYGAAAASLKPYLDALLPQDLRIWCEKLGQPTFVGSSGRVFPVAMKASPLLRAWLARLQGLGVRFAPRHRFIGFDGEGRLVFESPAPERLALHPAATILALGGASWPKLGSDGGWVSLLADRGVPIAPLLPANMGFAIAWSEHFRQRFEGQPLKRVALSCGDRAIRGEAMVTARGIEGGAVYHLSAPLREAIRRDGAALLLIDLRPDLDVGALAARLSAAPAGQSTSTLLRKAAGLAPVAIGLMREGAGPALPRESAALSALVKAVPLRLEAMAPIDRAISTAGGVAFEAVDANLMLKALPGVFVAGEMLDWDAPTGGYLLQAVFATGIAAAKGVIAYLGEPDQDGVLTRRAASATRPG